MKFYLFVLAMIILVVSTVCAIPGGINMDRCRVGYIYKAGVCVPNDFELREGD